MNRTTCGIALTGILGLAAASFAGSNQMPASTQPTTQPGLSGKVLSSTFSPPSTQPADKPPVYVPPTNDRGGSGSNVGGPLFNGGIGPTIVPANNHGTAEPSVPSGTGGTATPTTRPAGR